MELAPGKGTGGPGDWTFTVQRAHKIEDRPRPKPQNLPADHEALVQEMVRFSNSASSAPWFAYYIGLAGIPLTTRALDECKSKIAGMKMRNEPIRKGTVNILSGIMITLASDQGLHLGKHPDQLPKRGRPKNSQPLRRVDAQVVRAEPERDEKALARAKEIVAKVYAKKPKDGPQ